MKPRILIFSVDYFPYVGGAEIAIREICRRLPEFDFNLITCRNQRRLPGEELIDNVRVFRVGLGRRFLDKYLLPLTAFFKARQLHKEQSYQAIWGIMANQASLAALFFKIFYPKVPYFLTLQEGDPEEYYWRRTWFWRPLYLFIYKKADQIQTISHYLAERARRYGYQGEINVVANGVDFEHFAKRDEEKIKRLRRQMDLAGKKIIISVSRLAEKNGLADLIKGFALLNKDRFLSARLLLVGEGEQKNYLQRLTRRLKLENKIIFLGYIPHQDLPSYLHLADVFVRPSLAEGLGNSFLEAMAAGLPIIGTPVGGIVDFLKDGQTGVFCQSGKPTFAEASAGKPAAVAAAIEKLLKDDNLREKLIKNSRLLVKNNYNWEKIAGEIGLILKKPIMGKILIAAAIFPPDIGGPATYTSQLVGRLKERGVAVEVVSHTQFRQLSFLARYWSFFWEVYRLAKKSDWIFAQDVFASGFPAALVSWLRGRPLITKIVGDFSWEYARNNNLVEDGIDNFQKRKTYSWRLALIRKIQKFVCAQSRFIITPSQYLKTIVKQWSVPAEKIKVIYNAVDPEKFGEKSRTKKNDKITLLTVGRLVPWKGFAKIIEAMPELLKSDQRFQLVIVGDGPLRQQLEEQVVALDLGRAVQFTGKISQEEVFQWLTKADIFILNTEYEGLPHIVLEAMAAGTPVITTAAGGNLEVIADRETGLIFPYNDGDALKKAVLEIVNHQSLKKLAANAREQVQQFNWQKNIDQLLILFKN